MSQLSHESTGFGSKCKAMGWCPNRVLEQSNNGEVVSSHRILEDGTRKFDRRVLTLQPILLILALNHDESSWSNEWPSGLPRTEEHFLDLLAEQVNLTQVSLGVFTASKTVYERLILATSKRNIARTTILHHQDTVSFPYADRHKENVQYERRASLAILRNELMFRALEDETHIIWLDVDVIGISPNLFQTMLQQADEKKDQVGLITARCQQASMSNYDKNAWSIDQKIDGIMFPIQDDQRQFFNKKLIKTRKYITEQIKGLNDDELGSLDSVGGTSLYIRASLIRQGVNFPYFKIVGTTWARGGWTGQETEGICYMAKRLKGAGCWALGGRHFTRHSQW